MPASASSGMRHNVMNKNRKTPGNAGDERRKTPIFVSLSLSLSLLYLLEYWSVTCAFLEAIFVRLGV